MTEIFRQRALWNGFPGAPGYSNFYFNVSPNPQWLSGFFNAMKGPFPNDVHIQCESQGDIVNVQTGQITGTWNNTPTAPVVDGAGGTGGYAGSAGAVVNWLASGQVLNGRRLQGRTYLVPLFNGAFTNGGQLAADFGAGIRTAAAGFITAAGGAFVVYSRPRKGNGPQGAGTLPRAGVVSPVISSKVPNFAAVMRSRRG